MKKTGYAQTAHQTGRIAKMRLRQMKIAEATDCSMEELEQMKEELARTISKYINIGNHDIHLYLKRGKKATILVSTVTLPSSLGDEAPEIMKRSS
ncbi:MAG: cell division topological specificity factor MinE [Lachnospiraceae bacterium]|nr:cell division topological specificity factor MinE [Lachnospiraceae bacterium]